MKTFFFWILAFLITVSAAIYQRKTGPTHPKSVEIESSTGSIELSMLRSHGGETDCPLIFTIENQSVGGEVKYRRFPTEEQWTTKVFIRDGNQLKGSLPNQPPAGKIEYILTFYEDGKQISNNDELHTVVRFKGAVPGGILIPHILFMFLTMLLANLALIMAIDKHKQSRLIARLTLIALTIGGMIFGPIVQLYAFGDLWTGVPFGWDLTDNKTLIAFIAWIAAIIKNRKEVNYRWIIGAAVVTFIIFAIPHSMFGSELNYETGHVTQG